MVTHSIYRLQGSSGRSRRKSFGWAAVGRVARAGSSLKAYT